MNSTVTKRNASCPRCRRTLSEDVDSGYTYHWWRCDACAFVWIAKLGPDSGLAGRNNHECNERDTQEHPCTDRFQ